MKKQKKNIKISLKSLFLLILFFIVITIIITVCLNIYKNKIYELKYKNRISELTNDNIEIEKKWLIDKDKIKYDLSEAKVYEIEQTYINFSPEIRIRRVNDTQFSFTLKYNMTSDGLVRDELDFLIDEKQYNELKPKQVGNTVYKTRYKLLKDGQVIAIDIFKGDLEGLAYMEIEFASIEEANLYETPDWVIKDVTDDIRYKNASLAQYGIPEKID